MTGRAFIHAAAVAAATGLSAVLLTADANAQAPSDGKRVIVNIGYPPGGGFDKYGRLVARHVSRFLPGDPSTIARNVPGAGSVRLANYLYNVAPKDGTEFGIIGSSVPFGPLMKREGTEFDPTKFNWLGSLDSWVGMALVWHEAPARTIQDAMEREVIVGATGSGDVTVMYPKVLNELLGTKFKIVAGYKGTKDLNLAIEQGEVHGRLGWCWNCLKSDKADWVKDKKVRVLVQLAFRKHPDLQNVPLAVDLARNADDRKIMQLVFASQVMARPFLAPPAVPADRLRDLRDAFDEMTKDAAFLADARKVRAPVNLTSGQEIENIIKDVYATPQSIVDRATAIINSN